MEWAQIILLALKLVILLVGERRRDEAVEQGAEQERARSLERFFNEVRTVAGVRTYYDGLSSDERERLRDKLDLYAD